LCHETPIEDTPEIFEDSGSEYLLDKAIELDHSDISAWNKKGGTLNNLGI